MTLQNSPKFHSIVPSAKVFFFQQVFALVFLINFILMQVYLALFRWWWYLTLLLSEGLCVLYKKM